MLFDWYAEKREHKTVKLTNIYMCKQLTCNDIINHLTELGIYEWKRRMSYILSDAVLKAYGKEEKMADITKMFSYDLVSIDENGQHTQKQEEVCEILMKTLFNPVKETDNEIIVSLKGRILKC